MAPMKRMLNSLNPMKSHGGVKEKSGESKEKSAENVVDASYCIGNVV